MIAEFEARLAEVLGARLPAPFAGRVRVAPSNVPAGQPSVTLGVVRAERLADDLGGAPERVAPGAGQPRRVVALRCTVDVSVRAASGQGRTQQMAGIDAALHALEAPDLRRGTALAGGAPDPGFLVHRLVVADALVPLAPEDAPAGEPPVRIAAEAEGIFWPVGLAGQAGAAIGEIRLRGIALPVEVGIAAAPVAGGAPVDVTIGLGAPAGLRLRAGQPPASLPFERVAVGLRGPGGRPGAGALQGGAAGTDGVRLALLDDGVATLRYAPPADPARDELVVALDDGAGGLGVELGRLPVETT
ncbi:MAG TPA: hypothetical protein VLB47_11320 [Solirubrobacteraceae bacterium]|nr:hypothetical protein [Solirubrobacteraceae bacterium]